MNKSVYILFLFLLISGFAKTAVSKTFTKHVSLMGTDFYFNLILEDSLKAENTLNQGVDLVSGIENQISSWLPESVTSQINKNAGIKPVRVPNNLFYLIKRSIYISKLTDGLFDITYASLDQVWYFHKKMPHLPKQEEIDSLRSVVDYRKIVLDETEKTVFLSEKGMKIGFGAIGKGYAANRVKALFIELGISAGLINAGGDLIAWGQPNPEEKWTIAISDPKQKNKSMAYLEIGDEAVVTSGNYERFIYHEGIKYTHIINPKTGMPSQGVQSVTVICPDAELADGLATGLFLMSPPNAILFVNSILNLECIIVDNEGKVFSSENINLNYE